MGRVVGEWKKHGLGRRRTQVVNAAHAVDKQIALVFPDAYNF